MRKHSSGGLFITDLIIIAISIIVAVVLVQTDFLIHILNSAREFQIIGTFITGMFFTSIFTTAPSIVTLGEMARENSILLTAILGGLGAVVGDLIIFRFIRDRMSGHLMELLQHQGVGKRLKALMRLRYFRRFSFLIGGLIIASPLPDELGISLLGFSKMKTRGFLLLSFVANFAGIVLIGLVARAI